MTPGAEDLSMMGGNNNVVPLLPRPTVELEFRNITCNMTMFIANKLRFGKSLFFSFFACDMLGNCSPDTLTSL